MSSEDDPSRDSWPQEADSALEQAFARALCTEGQEEEGSSMRIVIPNDLIDLDGTSLQRMVDSVSAEWGEIENLLSALEVHDSGSEDRVLEDAVAVVSEKDLGDPEALAKALEPLQSEANKLEFLYDRAKYGLDRLSDYELSDLSPSQLLAVLRTQQNYQAVQNLVGFLRSLNRAAETFEALSLPRSQIRQYLKQLYSMEDWREMESWVRWLETAVAHLSIDDAEE